MSSSFHETATTVAASRILIVDDDPGIRSLLVGALEGEEVEAGAADSATAALERMDAGEEWDLVITDLRMPDMAGEALIEALAERHARVDTVIITGHPTFESARIGVTCNVRDYVEKPIRDLDEFRDRMYGILKHRHRRREKARHYQQLAEENRELDTQKTLLARNVKVLQRNLQGQLRTLKRSREVFYTDLSRVMAILDSLVDGILFTDSDGKVILMNPAAAEMIETPVFSAMGKHLGEVGGHSGFMSLFAAHRAMELNDGGVKVELATKRPDGNNASYTVQTQTIQDYQGHLAGDLTLIRDISIRKKTQELKNQFLSIVAHELRTPLTTIKAFATILDKGIYGELREDQSGVVANIIGQSDRLGHEIDKIINLARMESKDFSPDLASFKASKVVATLLKPFQTEAKEKGVSLTVLDDSKGAHVHADLTDIRRALRALVENAIKFTTEGGEVEIRVVPEDDSVAFEVRDTGIGVARKDHSLIFEKFIQIENPLTRQHGGLGLGLSFAAEILRAHGSRIEVESELGKGALFRFRVSRLPGKAEVVRAIAVGSPTRSLENTKP